jgi:hypothetical protein
MTTTAVGVATMHAHAADAPAGVSPPVPRLVRDVWPYVCSAEVFASQLAAEKEAFFAWFSVTHRRVTKHLPTKLWESYYNTVQHVTLAACEITVPIESDAAASLTPSHAQALRCGWGCSIGGGWVLCSAHLLTAQRDADAASFEFIGASIDSGSCFSRLLLRVSACADGDLHSSNVDCALVYVHELEDLSIDLVRSLAPTVFKSEDYSSELRIQLMITRNAEARVSPSASELVPTLEPSSVKATSDGSVDTDSTLMQCSDSHFRAFTESIAQEPSAWMVAVGDLGFATVEVVDTVSTVHSLSTVRGQSGTFVAALPEIDASPIFLGMIQGALTGVDGAFSAVTPFAFEELLSQCLSIAAMFRDNGCKLAQDVTEALVQVQLKWAQRTVARVVAPTYDIIPFNKTSWMKSTTIKPRRVSKQWMEKFRFFADVLKCCTMDGHWIQNLKVGLVRTRGCSTAAAEEYAREVRASEFKMYNNESWSRHHDDLITSLPQPPGTQYWEMRPFPTEDAAPSNLMRFVMLARRRSDGQWEPDTRYRFASVDHYHDPREKAKRKLTPSCGWIWVI